MKILTALTIMAIAALTFNVNAAKAETCADGAGTVITGKNGHNYCYSNQSMNWWSAYAWCEAQGRHLASMYEACPTWDGSKGGYGESAAKCPNIIGANILKWTSTPEGENNAFYVSSNDVVSDPRSKQTAARAFCY